MINPVNEILPETPKELQSILDRFSSLINESVNYGTHILKWDVEKERDGKDSNIPSVFLRNILELVDAISILLHNCSVDPSKIIFRSLIESCFGLKYMLEKDEPLRIKSFIVCKTVEKIKNFERWIDSSSSFEGLKSKIDNDDLNVDLSRFYNHSDFKNLKEHNEELLNEPEFKPIYEEYVRTKKKLNKTIISWYSLFDGPQDFQKLSEHLCKSLRYELIFKTYSDNVHGTSVIKGFTSSNDGKVQVIQIRDFENVQEVFSHTVCVLLELYFDFIRKRIPEKQTDYQKWFQEFNKPFLDITRHSIINYKK